MFSPVPSSRLNSVLRVPFEMVDFKIKQSFGGSVVNIGADSLSVFPCFVVLRLSYPPLVL